MEITSKEQFDSTVLKGDKITLVDFFAPWCGPCQMMLPLLEEIEKESSDDVQIVKVNVDDQGELAQEYGIMSIPAFKVFKGGKVIAEALGARSKEELQELLKS